MPGERGELVRGAGADAVAAVVEHEPLLAGDPVAAQAQPHLGRELLEHGAVGDRCRRAEHERDRARQVAADVRVRPADVGEQQSVLAEVLRDPGGVDDRAGQ